MSWELLASDRETCRSIWICREADLIHYKVVYCADDIVDCNRADYNASFGSRWGNGKIIASVPLNIYYEQLAAANNQGDDRFLSKWLNDVDNQAFRTFRGKV